MISSTQHNKRRYIIRSCTLALTAVIVAAALGYRQYESNQRFRAALQRQQERQQQRAKLDQLVELRFAEPVPLQQWFDEFTRQTGMRIEIASRSNTSAEERWFQLLVDAETPMSLSFPPLPAREALDVLGELYSVHWLLRDDGVVLLKADWNDDPKFAKPYSIPPSIPLSSTELCNLIRKPLSLPYVPGFEGSSVIREVAGSLVIVETERGHVRIEPFLNNLATAYERSRSLPLTQSDSSDPALAGVWLKGDPLVDEKPCPALTRPITLSASDMPLGEFVAELSRQTGAIIVIHPRMLLTRNLDDLRMSCQLRDTRLVDASLELEGIGTLGFEVLAGGNLLALSTQEHVKERGPPRAVVAYPVRDLTRLERNGRSRDELLALVNETISRQVHPDVVDDGEGLLDATGELLLLEHRLDVQQAVQSLLFKLREVQSGQRASARLEPVTHRRVKPVVEAYLDTPIAFEYRGRRRSEAMRDMFRRGGVSLPAFEGGLLHAVDPVWCYLPEAPLRENLERFLTVCHYDRHYLDHVQLDGELPEVYVDREHQLETEAFDLRPWLNARGTELNVGRLLQSVLEPECWESQGGESSIGSFRHLLVVRSHPQMLTRVRELLPVLTAHVAAGQPKVWRGRELSGAALDQPLQLLAANDEQVTFERDLAQRNREIVERLRTTVSIHVRERTIGEVIVELAREHQIPLVVHSLPTERPGGYIDPFGPTQAVRHLVSLKVENRPLSEIFEKLTAQVTGGDAMRWVVRHGCLTFGASDQTVVGPGWLYSVDDLIAPRGKLLPRQLVRTIEEQVSQKFGGLTVYAPQELEFHIGNLLWLKSESRYGVRRVFEDALRRLRTGELQPARSEKGDADFSIPYYPDSEWGPYTVPVVGSRGAAILRGKNSGPWKYRLLIDR